MDNTPKASYSAPTPSETGGAGAPGIKSLCTREEVLIEIQKLLVLLFHVGLGEPDEPRPPEEMEHLAEGVTRAIGSCTSLRSLQETLEMLKCLAQEYGIGD